MARWFLKSLIQITADARLSFVIVVLATQSGMSKEGLFGGAGRVPFPHLHYPVSVAINPAADEGIANLSLIKSDGMTLSSRSKSFASGTMPRRVCFALRRKRGQGLRRYTGQFSALFIANQFLK